MRRWVFDKKMNAEIVGKPLTQPEMAHVAGLCRKRKLREALAAHLFFSLGIVPITNVETFLTDPQYVPAINRSVFEVWRFFSPEYLPSEKFESLLRDVSSPRPLDVVAVDVLYRSFLKAEDISI